MLSSLVAGRIGAAGSVRDGYESGSAIGRGTKWSVAGEAVLERRAAGSGAPRKGDLRLPGAAEETDDAGGQTASPP